jgi:hypothetical protein
VRTNLLTSKNFAISRRSRKEERYRCEAPHRALSGRCADNVGCLPESGNQGHISERGITQFGSEFFNRSYPIADMRKVRRKNGANGRSNIEGKVARVATNERWAASEFQLGSNSANDERMTNGNVMLMLMIEGQHPTPINREQAWWNALSSTRWQ